MNFYEPGSVVWVQLSNRWWPGRVKALSECPVQYLSDLKKEPLAIVNFFNEKGLHHVTKQEQIFSYNCNRKMDFIRKGLSAVKSTDLLQKFQDDVIMAEKLTGGNMDIIKELKVENKKSNKRRIDYSDLGFGEPRAKKAPKDESHQKRGFTNIGEAILYKRGHQTSDDNPRIEHVIKIMEQKPKTDEMTTSSTNWFKCQTCGFTCGRLNVIVWHNKSHMKKVMNYDSGIKVPGRRRRKPQSHRKKEAKSKLMNRDVVNNLPVNGHLTSPTASSQEAQQLLLDWDEDEDDKVLDEAKKANGVPTTNGLDEEEDDDGAYGDDVDDDYDYPPSQPRRERQPMPKQDDINSAFDALLADTSPLITNSSINHNNSSYINNDSDSDYSDWEKYYNKDSDSEKDQQSHSKSDKTNQNGYEILNRSSHDSPSKKTTHFKSKVLSPSRATSSRDEKGVTKSKGSCSPTTEPSEDQSSSTSSTSSGPAYMLVAVDAQGNNVPMPVLSEGGNHLVAVEASMEDGTTRTLYIDPAHLGPNVDLNNLMLHIDNSGQETVIIPTSTSDGEIISSALVDQLVHDSSTSKTVEEMQPKRQPTEQEDSETSKSTNPVELKLGKFKKKRTSVQMELKKDDTVKDSLQKVDPIQSGPLSESQTEDEDLPDLGSIDDTEYHKLFSADDIVWVLTHGHWWPSFILKLHRKENRASIFYINCQQSVPIKVALKRLKAFTHVDFQEIFEKQENKAVGLTEAMEMANQYKVLRDAKLMKEVPRDFFSLPIANQRTMINKLTMIRRGVQIDDVSCTLSKDEKVPIEKADCSISSMPVEEAQITLSEEEKMEKRNEMKRVENEPFISYIRSEECLQHLRSVVSEQVSSVRHEDFIHLSQQLPSYWTEMNRIHNPGIDFFGEEETLQIEEIISYLQSIFLASELNFLDDPAKRRMYINLVLLPEAIKQSLRVVAQVPEEKLEEYLATGISHSEAEK